MIERTETDFKPELLAAKATITRWREQNLPAQELEKIQTLATEVFEDQKDAAEWLQEPNVATYNQPPISLLGTPEGYERVKQVLMRIEYGNLA